MSLTEPLPSTLRNILHTDHNGADDVVIAVATDFSLNGIYGEEWLVVTQDRLQIYTLDGQPIARIDAPLTSLASPRLDALVGGGALVAMVDGKPVELIRYTNAKQRVFARVSKYLTDVVTYHEEIARGETSSEPVLSEEADDDRRCPRCKLLLPEGTTACPACMNEL